jgi:hypothetical protein
MNTTPSSSYKGFDIHPLVYKTDTPREWHERRPDRTYTASVVICEEGSDPAANTARVFPLPPDQWDSLGSATRAAIEGGRTIIDGFTPSGTMSGGMGRPGHVA